MRYEQMKDLRPAAFERRCGVRPETFRHLVDLVSAHRQKSLIKRGRPPKLSVEDQILLALEYRREGNAYFRLANSWGLHASSVCCIIKRVEAVLTESKAFISPGEKGVAALRPPDRMRRGGGGRPHGR